MNILNFARVIVNPTKLVRDLKANPTFGALYNFISIKGNDVSIHFRQNLTQTQIDAVAAFMATYSDLSVFDNLYAYLQKTIDPFVEVMMAEIRAENIEMGITQLGKTVDVLGFFENPVTIPGKTRPITLKGSLDTASLTVAIDVLNHYIANPSLYSDLAPFVTVERLTQWRGKIVSFLSAQ